MNPHVTTPLRFLLGLLAFALTAWAQATSDSATLRILQPASPTEVQPGTPVTFLIELESPSGTSIGPVTLYSGNQFLGVAEPLPQTAIFPPPPARFAFNWPRPAVGTHSVEAVALLQRPAQPGRELIGSAPVILVVAPVEPPTNSVPVVTVRTLRASVTEGEGPVEVFKLHRTGDLGTRLRVGFQMGGEAANGGDYAIPFNTTTAEFPAGEDSWEVVLRPAADSREEGSESVTLSILPPSGSATYVIGNPGRAESAIRDREAVRPASIAWVRPAQGSGFALGDMVVLEALATDPSGYLPDVVFEVADSDGRNAREIGASSIRFLVAPPNGTPIGHSLAWHSTNAFSGINRVRAHALNAAGVRVSSEDLPIVGRPANEMPSIRIAVEEAQASESIPESTFLFRIERSGAGDSELRVRFSVAGTASRGADYLLEQDPCPLCARPPLILTGDEVVLRAGVRSVRIGGTASSDALDEGDETVRIQIVPAADGAAPYRIDDGHDLAEARIVDARTSTELPRVTLHAVDAVGSETNAADTLRFEVRRSGPTHESISVHYLLSGSAQYLVDYKRLGELEGVDPSLALPAPLVVVIPEGGTNGFVEFTALRDERHEGDEHLVLTLIQPVPAPNVRLRPTYEISEPDRARGILLDSPGSDSASSVSVVATTPTAVEGSLHGRPVVGVFTLTRTGDANRPLTVRYAVSGTARNGRDFGYLDGDATIEAGARNREIRVVPEPDRGAEGTETVVLALLPGRGYVLGGPGSATVVIEDPNTDPSGVPTLTLTEPADGSVHDTPGLITMRVLAVDPLADIRRVEFLDGSRVLGVSEHLTRDAVIPGNPRTHEWTWTNPPAGRHELRARAEVRGSTVVSGDVDVLVNRIRTEVEPRLHPADTSAPAFQIDSAEFSAYATSWREGREWSSSPTSIPPAFVSRAGHLLAAGGTYVDRQEIATAPLHWIPADGVVSTNGSTSTGTPAKSGESDDDDDFSLVEDVRHAGDDDSGSILRTLWPSGLPERTPLSFVLLEVAPDGPNASARALSLQVIPAAGVDCHVVELPIGLGAGAERISHDGGFDTKTGTLRWGPFMDGTSRRLTAVITGATVGLERGIASFNGHDTRIRSLRSPDRGGRGPRIGGIERRTDGSIQLMVLDDVATATGSASYLEVSDDLVTWRRISESGAGILGETHVDSDAVESEVRYYRVVRD
jgi:hypothetical protein